MKNRNVIVSVFIAALVFVNAADAKKKSKSKKQSVSKKVSKPMAKKVPLPAPVVSAPARRSAPRPLSASTASIRATLDAGNYDEVLRLLGSSSDATARSLRALTFEKMGYSHAALSEYVSSYKEKSNRVVLNRAGATAFLLNESKIVQGLPSDNLGMRLALAQEALLMGDINQAKNLLPSNQVLEAMSPSPLKAKAVVLASAIYNATGNARAALEVLGGAFPQTHGVDLSEIRLQRALILFEVRKYAEALDELLYITRGSPTWFRGQTVGAWAAFHAEDYNLALGQLMNLRSPFLSGKFNPEKYLLSSVVLFQLCHYDSASRALKKLKEEYGNLSAVFARVDALADNPSRLYQELRSFASGKLKTDSSGTDRVYDGLLSEPFVANISNSIEKLRFERRALGEKLRARQLQGTRGNILGSLDRVEDGYLKKLSHYSRALLVKMKNDVKETLEGALAVDLEINTRIRDRLIRAQVPLQKNIDFTKEVQKGFEFWPFEGEFWRDETGGYAFATTDVCEEGAR